MRIVRPPGHQLRCEIREQVWTTDIARHSQADFVAERLVDISTPSVATYLDGFAFHASAANDRMATDAIRREELRDSGRLVWTATWDDVSAVEKRGRTATLAPSHSPPPGRRGRCPWPSLCSPRRRFGLG